MRKHFILVLRVVKDEFRDNKKVANLAPINHFMFLNYGIQLANKNANGVCCYVAYKLNQGVVCFLIRQGRYTRVCNFINVLYEKYGLPSQADFYGSHRSSETLCACLLTQSS